MITYVTFIINKECTLSMKVINTAKYSFITFSGNHWQLLISAIKCNYSELLIALTVILGNY